MRCLPSCSQRACILKGKHLVSGRLLPSGFLTLTFCCGLSACLSHNIVQTCPNNPKWGAWMLKAKKKDTPLYIGYCSITTEPIINQQGCWTLFSCSGSPSNISSTKLQSAVSGCWKSKLSHKGQVWILANLKVKTLRIKFNRSKLETSMPKQGHVCLRMYPSVRCLSAMPSLYVLPGCNDLQDSCPNTGEQNVHCAKRSSSHVEVHLGYARKRKPAEGWELHLNQLVRLGKSGSTDQRWAEPEGQWPYPNHPSIDLFSDTKMI